MLFLQVKVNMIERFEFYEVAKKAFAVVATGEGALYGNIILSKGVLPAEEQWYGIAEYTENVNL